MNHEPTIELIIEGAGCVGKIENTFSSVTVVTNANRLRLFKAQEH